jgi:hypothetical protein
LAAVTLRFCAWLNDRKWILFMVIFSDVSRNHTLSNQANCAGGIFDICIDRRMA